MTRQVAKASCGDPQSVAMVRRQTLRPDHKSPKSRPRSRARGVLRLNAGESIPKSYQQIASKLKSACGRRPTGRWWRGLYGDHEQPSRHSGCSKIPAAERTARRKSCMRSGSSTSGGH